jgi:putative ABC transport system permease protein
MNDLRYAIRTLLRSPGFTAVAVLTLALGIGANTAMFAVVNGVLLKPLPFRNAERLMLVHLTFPDREAGVVREGVWSYPKYRTFLDLQQSFDSTALFASRDLSVSGDGAPERVRGEVITDRYPGLLGVAPILGRSFTGVEAHREGEQPVAILSHSLWTRRYAEDPSILGRRIQIDATTYTVVGVLPPGFQGLSGNAELWVPFAVYEPRFLTQAYAHGYFQIARRKTGVPEEAAVAAVGVAGAQLAARYGLYGGDRAGAIARSLYSSRIEGDLRLAALMLLGAVAAVLLIACVNLTNLFIAKALGRRRETAVRLAIGASRLQVARQFIAESALLTAAGTMVGLMFASALLSLASSLLPSSDAFFRMAVAPGSTRISGAQGLTLVGASMIGLDAMTVLAGCATATVVAVLVAVFPAMQASALRPLDTLRGGRGTKRSDRLGGFGTRGILVTAQITLALVLLAGAGLMLTSVARLHSTAIGVEAEGVLTARIDLPQASYNNERRFAFYSELLSRVGSLPGVRSVGLANCPPVSGGCSSTSIGFERGRHKARPGAPVAGVHWASPDYFSTAGIRLVRGRLFDETDRVGRSKVVVINQAAARRFWPNDDPIGKSVTLGQGGFEDGAEVIGIVENVRYTAIEQPAEPDAYIPLLQSPQSRVRMFIRTEGTAETLIPAVRREVAAIDPSLPLSEVRTMDERIGEAMWRTRLAAWVLSGFALLAVVLTAVGIFGVMAQTVAQETRDIGVRMALGAQRSEVLRLVLSRAAMVTSAGVVIGVGAGVGVSRLAGALLYEVAPGDPMTFAAVALLLVLVALGASYVPARRATRVDPVVALRYE